MNIRGLFSLTLLPLVLLFSSLNHADAYPGIENLMDQDEFKATGLSKLSAEELTSLNQWMIKYTAKEAPVLRRTVQVVKDAERENVTTNIVGAFTGWTGKTKFRLANGEVWQQRMGGRYRKKLDSPQVIIKTNLFGYYELHIPSIGKAVHVKRIK